MTLTNPTTTICITQTYIYICISLLIHKCLLDDGSTSVAVVGRPLGLVKKPVSDPQNELENFCNSMLLLDVTKQV